MNILVFTYTLNGLLMIALPVGLAVCLTRRWKQSWSIWWIGAGTFILSQLVHIPFNWGVGLLLNRSGMVYWSSLAQAIFNSVFLGLSAGLFEEGARYFILSMWGKRIRSWRQGIVFGAGHGGMEAILFGLIALFGFIQLIILRQATPEQLVRLVGTERLAFVQAQLATAWATPWYLTLLGAVERLFTIPIQIFLAVLVLQAVSPQSSSLVVLCDSIPCCCGRVGCFPSTLSACLDY